MKRDINNLLSDRTTQEHDAWLRRSLKADDVAAARQLQAAEISKAQITKFRKALDKWNCHPTMVGEGDGGGSTSLLGWFYVYTAHRSL